MPSTPNGLNPTDAAIIRLLVQDGRLSASEIGRQIGVSPRTVRHRIEQLRERGIIRVVTFVNPRALGYTITADIFCEVEMAQVETVAQQVMRFPQVSYVACSIGDQDLSLQAYFESTEALYNFTTQKLAQIPGIRKIRTVVVPKVLKSVYEWQLPQWAGPDE
ncbi:MAG: Lrp/AsnC family transcriptional regulator [Ardenticatenaceae bacterium]|nr:Lrp/AsnC family transcriptional regulator [Ardenticatenaceae bacterium]